MRWPVAVLQEATLCRPGTSTALSLLVSACFGDKEARSKEGPEGHRADLEIPFIKVVALCIRKSGSLPPGRGEKHACTRQRDEGQDANW